MILSFLKKVFFEGDESPIPVIFSLAVWFASDYFKSPAGNYYYRAGAVLGMLAGYALSKIYLTESRRFNKRFGGPIIVVMLIVGVLLIVHYSQTVDQGHVAGFWSSFQALMELSIIFALVGGLMPVAGVRLEKAVEDKKKAQRSVEDGGGLEPEESPATSE
jgi:uncharacterized membrane protein YhhN